ncbi:hypothetical protein FRACYDRAFT_237057 [Fragilariopsis cylindrus CCMP1102]|uniref:Uncharacterized protein n=1 Tax=Fragilariopsis cylindrus CCMP1102 TaxID=635003 RepID=A0A1E7FL36_9STRA|nr:hypothetical protein FRACYDRAFT_237057 [Fragilariopsis cylindrus CCMP1102]|eukprot:OEU18775.1 hypothetical protein FRACYDRAFT_237057 [Fragilariopsis cylindrus CCMP1102]
MPQSTVEIEQMNGATGGGAAVPDAQSSNNLPTPENRKSNTTTTNNIPDNMSSSDEAEVKECISELSLDDDGHFEDEHDANLNETNNTNTTSRRRRRRQQSRLPSLASSRSASASASASASHGDTNAAYVAQERQDTMFVESFWTAYDEILILSIFTQVGILCRLLAAYWLKNFSDVFHPDSALCTVLPLNCLSCFIMGLLCSGESLMEIVVTRFTPPKLQRDLQREASQRLRLNMDDDDDDDDGHISIEDIDDDGKDMMETDRPRIGVRRRWQQRRRRRQRQRQNSSEDRRRINNQHQHQKEQDSDIYNELREVQLLAWERRIRASVCLLLFPVKKEDIDLVENYFSEGYRKDKNSSNIDYTTDRGNEEEKIEEFDEQNNGIEYGEGIMMGGLDDLTFEEIEMDDIPRKSQTENETNPPLSDLTSKKVIGRTAEIPINVNESSVSEEIPDRLVRDSDIFNPEQQGRNYARGNVRLTQRQYGQVVGGNIVDYGTTREGPDLDQIISNVATGVSNNISRIGRVNLANGWDVGTSAQEKSEDLTLGLRDGLCGALSSFSSWISSMVNLFRAGQVGQAFVGITLGIQLPIVAYRFDSSTGGYSSQRITRTKGRRTVHDEESEIPSIRAIFTALFIMCLVAQLTSLTFFKKPEDRLFALSLLFSPLGVLARWRMMKFNSWRPNFPVGTFLCNVTACALSGTLGTLLAGNPGPRERIALVSIIAGFGGTLSSVARFIVEILSLMDPILFRLDGLYYATASVLAGLLVSLMFAASVDWADSILLVLVFDIILDCGSGSGGGSIRVNLILDFEKNYGEGIMLSLTMAILQSSVFDIGVKSP